MPGQKSGFGVVGGVRRVAMVGLLLGAAMDPRAHAIGHRDGGQDWAMAETAMPELVLATESLDGERRLSTRATEGFRGLPMAGSWVGAGEMSEAKGLLLLGFGLFGGAGLCVAVAALKRSAEKAL